MSAEIEELPVATASKPVLDQPPADSGLVALVLIAAHFQIAAQPAQLRHELAWELPGIGRGSQRAGRRSA